MSYVQIRAFRQEIENLAKTNQLTLQYVIQNPKVCIIAQQGAENLTAFLISNLHLLIEFAIGENKSLNTAELNTCMKYLINSSSRFSEELSQRGEVINHIISFIFNQQDIDVYFINSIHILNFMIKISQGSILNKIDDNSFFFTQVMTFNTSPFLDDLLETIIKSPNFSLWILSIDIPQLLGSILSTPDNEILFNKTIHFLQQILIIFKKELTYVQEIETSVFESLINIGLHCLNQQSLRCLNFIIQTEEESANPEFLIHILQTAAENIEPFLQIMNNSITSFNPSYFGSLHYEVLRLFTFILRHIDFSPNQIGVFFEVGSDLWHRFLDFPTNSFLHNSFVDYFISLMKFKPIFNTFIIENNFLQIIPEILEERDKPLASYFGQLVIIAKLINDFIRSGDSQVTPDKDWLEFRKTVLDLKEKLYNTPFGGPVPKSSCYQDSDQKLRDILDKNIIDTKVGENHPIYEYEYAYEYEEEEEEFIDES